MITAELFCLVLALITVFIMGGLSFIAIELNDFNKTFKDFIKIYRKSTE